MTMSKRFNVLHFTALTVAVVIVGFFTAADAHETKSNRQGRVTVNVRPVQLVPGKPAKFEVRMNTHSVTLSQDLVAACTLKDSQGREYQPTNWNGSPPGSHHRKGILEFPELKGDTEAITLVIRQVANVPERIFEWPIER